MLPYIIVFVITEGLAIFINEKNNKKTTLFFTLVIIFILSVFGGMRSKDIGTDLSVYGYRWFEIACNSSNFMSYESKINGDIGYLFLNYIVSRFTCNFNVFLFILQFISNFLVIITLYRYKKQVPFWLSLMCFLTMFYCRNFNILRQSISLAIVFYMIKYLEEKNKIKFFLGIGVASLFHYSAVFGIVLYFIYEFCNNKEKKNKKRMYIIIGISILTCIFIEPVIRYLYYLKIVNYRVYNYLFEYTKSELDVSIFDEIFKIFVLTIIFIKAKKITKIWNLNYFLILSTILEFIFYQLRIKIDFADRISLYFGYFVMLIMPQCYPFIPRCNGREKVISKCIIVSILCLFWYYKFVYCGSCEVYPYSSIF